MLFGVWKINPLLTDRIRLPVLLRKYFEMHVSGAVENPYVSF